MDIHAGAGLGLRTASLYLLVVCLAVFFLRPANLALSFSTWGLRFDRPRSWPLLREGSFFINLLLGSWCPGCCFLRDADPNSG